MRGSSQSSILNPDIMLIKHVPASPCSTTEAGRIGRSCHLLCSGIMVIMQQDMRAQASAHLSRRLLTAYLRSGQPTSGLF